MTHSEVTLNGNSGAGCLDDDERAAAEQGKGNQASGSNTKKPGDKIDDGDNESKSIAERK